MMLKSAIKFLFYTAFALQLPSLVFAQDDISVVQGDFEVFYSAFNTSFLSPEVASATGIVRGRNKGLVNISVVRYDENGQRFPVQALSIKGKSYDLIRRDSLAFTEVVEQGARYYLAPFKISSNDEFIQFDIEVELAEIEKPVKVLFKRQFFKN